MIHGARKIILHFSRSAPVKKQTFQDGPRVLTFNKFSFFSNVFCWCRNQAAGRAKAASQTGVAITCFANHGVLKSCVNKQTAKITYRSDMAVITDEHLSDSVKYIAIGENNSSRPHWRKGAVHCAVVLKRSPWLCPCMVWVWEHTLSMLIITRHWSSHTVSRMNRTARWLFLINICSKNIWSTWA